MLIHVDPSVVGDGLRDLHREDEIFGRIPEPAQHHPLRRSAVEARVDFGGVEDLRIRGKLALAGGLVEAPEPLVVGPAGGAEPERPHRGNRLERGILTPWRGAPEPNLQRVQSPTWSPMKTPLPCPLAGP